jgi:lysozyme
MKTSNAGLELIKSFEGLRLKAYQCPSKKWTIGYGHTGKIYGIKIVRGLNITERLANKLLLSDVEKFEKKVAKYDKKYKWTQNEFDALVDFAFNIGSIDKLTVFGTRKKEVIADKILLYNKSNGKVLDGLTIRRHIERIRFLNQKGVIYNDNE